MVLKICKLLLPLETTICLFVLSACDFRPPVLNGYVEAQLTMLSSPTSGKLVQLFVVKGDRVKSGAPIYVLESFPESAEMDSAAAMMDEATANYKNLLIGKRPSEIEAIEAQIKATQAQIEFQKKEYLRRKDLLKQKYVSKEDLDKTYQDLQVNRNQLSELQANLITAKLPARNDEVRAASWRMLSTKANLAAAQWRLNQKSVTAPRDGFVFDTYYRIGERVSENRPIASLLVSTDIKAVFFVPEPRLSDIKLKQKVRLSCDHCEKSFTGTIYYISPDAEYTPPVIYSNSARSKLVYRVEARISADGLEHLHPGQPIDIQLSDER